MRFVGWMVQQFGKAPGYAALAFAALLAASCLCAAGCLSGEQYVYTLAVILGAHFGGGVAVARRDQPAVKIDGGADGPAVPPKTAGATALRAKGE